MRILVTAKIANTTVGHVDHALAYAVGLKAMGHEVTLVDHVGRGRCVDASGTRVPFAHWDGLGHFEAVARDYGIWPQAALVGWNRETHGLAFDRLAAIAMAADLLITRSGKIHKLPEIFEAPAKRAFFDGNPGSTQTLFAQQDAEAEPLDRYEHLFTLGYNIGTTASKIPCAGQVWHALPRPVVLSMYPPRIAADDACFTTISTWRGRGSFELDGIEAGQKSDNWLDYLDLPRRSGQAMAIALRLQGPGADEDRRRFIDAGWQLTDPSRLRCFADYRRFLAGSRAEFSVAHNRYVAFNTGWFSDRSAAYLACGKPVVVQSTGIEAHLPTGRGILTFTTPDEAVERIAEVNADYLSHAHAARAIAQEHFSAAKVLGRILEIVG
ncbi:MAG: glycosyltransferase [Rhodocyclaceae bacterium]|nr:glycosyltransferase [Rhodocyclaceae bacterium]